MTTENLEEIAQRIAHELDPMMSMGVGSKFHLSPSDVQEFARRLVAEVQAQSEPDGWVDGEGDPYCQHGWGKRPPDGWTEHGEPYPVYRYLAHPAGKDAELQAQQGEAVAWKVRSVWGLTRCIIERQPTREEFVMQEEFIPLYDHLAPPACAEGVPVATLHDDGHFTFSKGTSEDLKYQAQFAGWRMEVFATPQPPAAPAESAKAKFDRYYREGEEPSALERLRFFCSLSMTANQAQDWIDVEPFFDAIEAEIQAPL